ncbi:MIP/aquaporin family protein [Mariniblastus fucicola]|uniref:Putative glycerol uptake facilitator protein n=1 Tax=Mariniblastus fucicola TaxID=980251 RepID=A0A5B9P539_9BACT|nr:aquaporin [Mariniblastus fucicola]QEG20265.1 putative glycerol uptake facilitator protein [Mariniblastus fucicola]
MTFAKYLTEFIGTFFLVFVVCLMTTQPNDHTGIVGAIAIGSTLMIMVYMGGHVSGGHFNPAVTLACFLRGACSWVDVIPYWIAQVAGACVAAFLASVVLPVVGEDAMSVYANVAPAAPHSMTTLGPWVIEILFTFALALVVLNTATSSGTKGNSFYGLAIGFTVVVAAFAGGGISGGAFNPAVGVGPNIIRGSIGGDPAALANIALYIAGPMIGGALAAVVFKVQEAWVDHAAKLESE